MINNNLGKYLAVGSLAIGSTFMVTNTVNAAALEGTVSIQPFTLGGITVGGVAANASPGGVLLTYTGVDDPFGKPITGFEFLPSTTPTGFATALQFNGSGDFASFFNHRGLIRNVTTADSLAFLAEETGGPDFEISDFLRIYSETTDDNWNTLEYTFALDSISLPEYTSVGVGGQDTTISLNFNGRFINADDNSESFGSFTTALTFNGDNQAEVIALLSDVNNPYEAPSWTADAVVSAATVPEPSAVGGLMVFGLLGSMVGLKKRREKVLN